MPLYGFGENVRRLRKRSGFKGKDLASAMGVRPSVVSAWENNRSGLPETPTLFKLAKALKCPIDELLNGVDENYDTLMRDLIRHGLRQRRRLIPTYKRILDDLIDRYRVVLLAPSRAYTEDEPPDFDLEVSEVDRELIYRWRLLDGRFRVALQKAIWELTDAASIKEKENDTKESA